MWWIFFARFWICVFCGGRTADWFL